MPKSDSIMYLTPWYSNILISDFIMVYLKNLYGILLAIHNAKWNVPITYDDNYLIITDLFSRMIKFDHAHILSDMLQILKTDEKTKDYFKHFEPRTLSELAVFMTHGPKACHRLLMLLNVLYPTLGENETNLLNKVSSKNPNTLINTFIAQNYKSSREFFNPRVRYPQDPFLYQYILRLIGTRPIKITRTLDTRDTLVERIKASINIQHLWLNTKFIIIPIFFNNKWGVTIIHNNRCLSFIHPIDIGVYFGFDNSLYEFSTYFDEFNSGTQDGLTGVQCALFVKAYIEYTNENTSVWDISKFTRMLVFPTRYLDKGIYRASFSKYCASILNAEYVQNEQAVYFNARNIAKPYFIKVEDTLYIHNIEYDVNIPPDIFILRNKSLFINYSDGSVEQQIDEPEFVSLPLEPIPQYEYTPRKMLDVKYVQSVVAVYIISANIPKIIHEGRWDCQVLYSDTFLQWIYNIYKFSLDVLTYPSLDNLKEIVGDNTVYNENIKLDFKYYLESLAKYGLKYMRLVFFFGVVYNVDMTLFDNVFKPYPEFYTYFKKRNNRNMGFDLIYKFNKIWWDKKYICKYCKLDKTPIMSMYGLYFRKLMEDVGCYIEGDYVDFKVNTKTKEIFESSSNADLSGCIINTSVRYMCVLISVQDPLINEAHANTIFIDKKTKDVLFFDPHGIVLVDDTPYAYIYQNNLSYIFEELGIPAEIYGWNVKIINDVHPYYGPQTTEAKRMVSKKYEFGGYCLPWCLYMIEYYLRNKFESSEDFIYNAYKKIAIESRDDESGILIVDPGLIMRKYIQHIEAVTEKILEDKLYYNIPTLGHISKPQFKIPSGMYFKFDLYNKCIHESIDKSILNVFNSISRILRYDDDIYEYGRHISIYKDGKQIFQDKKYEELLGYVLNNKDKFLNFQVE